MYLLKDFKNFLDIMIHLSETGTGMSYKRFNTTLQKVEYLGYAGHFGAWTDNTTYYSRKMMPNTQFHRKAQQLKIVSWLSLNNRIEGIQLDMDTVFAYDIYIYHGCIKNCGLPDNTQINIYGSFEFVNSETEEVCNIKCNGVKGLQIFNDEMISDLNKNAG